MTCGHVTPHCYITFLIFIRSTTFNNHWGQNIVKCVGVFMHLQLYVNEILFLDKKTCTGIMCM